MRKIAVSMLIVISIFSCHRVLAQETEFDTTYNIDYSVDNSLEVTVKENIAVINQTASAVPSSFIETITNISIYDIKVSDAKDKEVIPQIEEKDKSLVIKIPIENPAIGKDKKTQITLSYKTRDLAQKTGRILNVTIPKAPVSNYMQEYNVALKIPKDFGPQISVTPKPVQEKMEEEGYTLLYNKQTLEQYGISATFGDYQVFDFELGGELKNSSWFSKTARVVLPPQLKDYQEVSILQIDPKPTKLVKDADGNILADYKIPGNGSVTYTIKGRAKVYNRKIDPEKIAVYDKAPRELSRYLTPGKYWETGNKTIQDLASQQNTPQKIYNYLIKNVGYDYEVAKSGKVAQRKGAVKVLEENTGLCLDFTDAFITLARSAGIPAREINGYAYTKDQTKAPAPLGTPENMLHSWVQYHHPEYGWVSLDPTWGATSGLDYFSRLDNNHLAFMIKSSDTQNFQTPQTISVEFSDAEFSSNESLYKLDDLQVDGDFTSGLGVIVGAGAGLALCTILVVILNRLKGR